MHARSALAVVLLLAGCLARPDHEVAGIEEVHADETLVLTEGRLDIPVGSTYVLERATLALHDDPDVTVDGVIHVRGTFTAKDATITNLFRLVVEPGARLAFDNVTLRGGPIPPSLDLRSDDVDIRGGDLHVRLIDVRGAASITGARIRGDAALPVVWWRDAPVVFRDNVVETAGVGVVLERALGEVTGNTITAGDTATSFALAVRGGNVVARGNTVTGGVGIAFESAAGEVRDNVVRGATSACIAMRGATASVVGNDVADCGRAGIYLSDATSSVVVSGNTVARVGDGRGTTVHEWGAGIAVDGGAPVVAANDVTEADVGIVVLLGTPSAHANNLAGNRHAGAALANATDVDFTMNWWGAATGPVPANDGPGTAEAPSPAGADRVDPRIRFAPWRHERRP